MNKTMRVDVVLESWHNEVRCSSVNGDTGCSMMGLNHVRQASFSVRVGWSRLIFLVVGLVAAVLMLGSCGLSVPTAPARPVSAFPTESAENPPLPIPSIEAGVVVEQPIVPASELFPFGLPALPNERNPADLEIQGPAAVMVDPGGSVAYTLTVRNRALSGPILIGRANTYRD